MKDRATPVGTDSVVFLDLGEEDGLYPGDFLTVYRHAERQRDDPHAARRGRRALDEGPHLRRQGHLDGRRMGVGDSVELK